jgi:sugar phosphate isomerase/epimerase
MSGDSISRRRFNQIVVSGSAMMLAGGRARSATRESGRRPVRLGGPVFVQGKDPDAWAEAHRRAGYGAALCPVGPEASDAEVAAFRRAAGKSGLVIAEVGAWSNPMAPDAGERAKALEKCRASLALADRIGAICCVNIAGSAGTVWDGPDPANLTGETFDRIVDTTRSIIDAVKPSKAFYTLETMPWMYPDSPDSYLRLIKAIDRKAFAAHLDPVNMICSPQRYFGNAGFLRECFKKLGSRLKSCHAKDILLQPKLTTHLDEVRPGLGGLDYSVYLEELSRLPEPPPLIIEHLQTEEEYALAAEHIRGVGKRAGISFIEAA